MKKWRRKEGKYLLRSNMLEGDPATIWKQYLLLTEIEQAFKELKSDLAVRPVYHSKDERIEAHIFVAFQAYCLNVTLKNLLKNKAAGLTPKAVLEKLSEIQMVDVYIPTTDGRTIVLSRYTKPKEDHQLLLNMIGMSLPKQPNPRLLEEHGKIKEEKPEPSPLMRRFGFGLRKPQKKYSRQQRKRFLVCSGDPPSTYRGFSRPYPIRPP
jgi:hypothetical protein